METPIEKAIRLAGGISELANQSGVSYQAVQQWRDKGVVPARRCVAVSKATNGSVLVHELNPEVFGGLQEAG